MMERGRELWTVVCDDCGKRELLELFVDTSERVTTWLVQHGYATWTGSKLEPEEALALAFAESGGWQRTTNKHNEWIDQCKACARHG